MLFQNGSQHHAEYDLCQRKAVAAQHQRHCTHTDHHPHIHRITVYGIGTDQASGRNYADEQIQR